MNIISDLSSLERRRREVLARCELVTPLPATVTRVLGILGDPQAEACELEAQLAMDPALAARLLSMANSPLYGLGGEISDLGRAIVVIGFSGIRSLVLASGISQEFQSDYSRYGHDHHGLWRHSIAVAAAARSLAKHIKLNSQRREQLFVAGLLHDLGKMVLVSFLNEDGEDLPGEDDLAEELRRFGVHHAEAGVLIAAKLGLGESIMNLIGEHHHIEPVDSEEMADNLALLRLAQAFAHESGLGYAQGRAPKAEFRPADMSLLHLGDAAWEAARAAMETEVQSALAAMASLSGE